MKPYIIGLTGGIASGKTAVGLVFETLGAKIIDADVVSRKTVELGSEGARRLKEAFAFAFDGDTLNRGRLKEKVFLSEDGKCRLDEIMLPLIEKEIEREAASLDGETVAVLIAPLLLESGLQRLCDTVVTVSAPYEMRLSRLLARDGIDASLAAAIMNSQLSDEERECRSDAVIRNDGDIKSLREQAKTLYNEICERIRIR